jgi:chromosome segregation ATPase
MDAEKADRDAERSTLKRENLKLKTQFELLGSSETAYKAEIESLKLTNTTLTADAIKAKRSGELALKQEKDNLLRQLDEEKTEYINQLKSQHENMLASADKANKKALEKTNSALTQCLASLDTQRSYNNTLSSIDLAKIQTQIGEATRDLQQQNHQLQKDRDAALSQLKQTHDAALAKLKQEHDVLAEKCATETSQLKTKHTNINKTLTDLKDAKSQSDQACTASLQTEQSRFERLKSSFTELEARNSTCEGVNKNITAAAAEREAEADSQRAHEVEVQTKNSKKDAKRQKDFEAAKAQNAQFEIEITRLQSELREVTGALEKIRATSVETEHRLSTAQKEHSDTKESLQMSCEKTIKEQAAKIDTLSAAHADLEERYVDMDAQLRDEIEQLKNDVVKLTAELAEQSKEAKRIQDASSKQTVVLEDEKQTLKKRLDQQAEELARNSDEQSASKRSAIRDIEELSTNLTELMRKSEIDAAKIAEKEADLKLCNNQFKSCAQTNVQQLAELNLEKTKSLSQNKQLAEAQTLTTSLDNQLKATQIERDTFAAEVESIKHRLSSNETAQLKQLSNEKDDAVNKLTKMQTAVERIKNVVKEKSLNESAAKQLNAESLSKIEIHKQTISELKKQMDTERIQCASEFKVATTQLHAETSKAVQAERALLENQIQSLKDTFQKEIDKLSLNEQRCLVTLQKEKETAKQQSEESDKRCNEKGRLSDEQSAQTLKKTASDYIFKMAAMQSDLDKAAQVRERALAEREKVIKSGQDTIQRLEKEVSTLRRSNSSLMSDTSIKKKLQTSCTPAISSKYGNEIFAILGRLQSDHISRLKNTKALV